jgi:hypothetical protein
VAVFYGIMPITGAFYVRYRWRQFRKRFIDLGIAPILDYRNYRKLACEGGIFRFTGEIESITDGRTLWVKGDDLTIPVSLENTKCFLMPKSDGDEIPEPPEQIRWNRVSTLTEGVKVFIGGLITTQNNRLIFLSTKENPLIVIFYNCHESELTNQIIMSARSRNEYWNTLTPVALGIGALSLVYIAASLLNRPAFRLTVVSALIAVFIPVLPFIPPGLLFVNIYRRMIWYSGIYKAYWDIVRRPLQYLGPDQENVLLNNGERFGYVKMDSLPADFPQGDIPYLIPQTIKEEKSQQWYFFGILPQGNNPTEENPAKIILPEKSKDPFVCYGILPAKPEMLIRRYITQAYSFEVLAWGLLILDIVFNGIFIGIILSLFINI